MSVCQLSVVELALGLSRMFSTHGMFLLDVVSLELSKWVEEFPALDAPL